MCSAGSGKVLIAPPVCQPQTSTGTLRICGLPLPMVSRRLKARTLPVERPTMTRSSSLTVPHEGMAPRSIFHMVFPVPRSRAESMLAQVPKTAKEFDETGKANGVCSPRLADQRCRPLWTS